MGSTAARFQIRLRDQLYSTVAIFDLFKSLSYRKEVNGVGSYDLSFRGDESRISLFELDGMIDVYRSVPGSDVPWEKEFTGLHRSDRDVVSDSGENIFTSTGVGLNDFLSRTIINYPPATIKAYKNAPAETAMKEYVEENCGASATILASEREIDGVLQDFIVASDGAHGDVWEGDRAWQNLLDVLKEISKFSQIDYDVYWDEISKKFVFQTYITQLGTDRTLVGLDSYTGLNASGNAPVIFSLANGNLQSLDRSYNRMSESNSVTVTGEGEGATVSVQVRTLPSILDSPWNRREVSRPCSGFESEMQTYGDGVLQELSAKDIINFVPLSQSSCLYGKHYFLGDRVSFVHKGIVYNKRIFSISNSISGDKESLSIVFSDLQ